MRRLLSTTLALGIGAFISSPTLATTVEVVQGQVSVNQGQGYQQIAAASAVSPGDQVMAAPGGRGKIVYSDGCALDVYPGAVLTVPEKCYQPMRAGLEEVPAAHPFPWVPAALATGVVVVGVCAIADCISDEDHHRRKPKKEKERTEDGGDDNED